MGRLNQVLAVEKNVKSRAYAKLSELYKVVQKPDLFNGFTKTYQPKDEAGEKFPPENKKVQVTAPNAIMFVMQTLNEIIDVSARREYTNTAAKADVIVDDQTLIKAAPATFLLFLEKQLTDLATFINSLPMLDDNETWQKDSTSELYKSDPTQTHRTKKIQKPLVLYPATDKHPAQTQLITEDETVGFWQQTKLSGAIQKSDKAKFLERVVKLLKAVKEAREAANMQEELPAAKGDVILNWVFAP